jgi:uncharacterized DUF497 family protein
MDTGHDVDGTKSEWDEDKAEANIEFHNVSFFEAATVFLDDYLSYTDDVHSEGERRARIVGRSNRDRILVVCNTERGDVVRIISAWEAEHYESWEYEEQEV